MIFLHRLWLAIFVRETRMALQAIVLWYLQHTELKADFPMAYLLLSLGIKEDHKKIPASQNSSESWGCQIGEKQVGLGVKCTESNLSFWAQDG
jgi:hypothetical protein